MVIKVGVENTLSTWFEMNDFFVFNVHIGYFFLRRVHIDVHSRNVVKLGKRKDVRHGRFIAINFNPQ